MGKESKIGWTDSTWNPVLGCDKVSPGCLNCYAEVIAEKYRGQPGYPNGFELTLKPNHLRDPIRWREPRRIFVNSMSDLFHPRIPDDYLREIWDVMLEEERHTYQILTKRPVHMKRRIANLGLKLSPHIWLGVSVENQEWANRRIPVLLSIPAEVRFLSCEPLLGPVDLAWWFVGVQPIHWVLMGAESGPKRRPFDPQWVRDIRDVCVAAGVPLFHKQGSHLYSDRNRDLDGREWNEYPDQPQPTPQLRGQGALL
tara:strand:+ start:360 stop:1124 length:765 start_codon:yes stop_codon:yes gene_type:complete